MEGLPDQGQVRVKIQSRSFTWMIDAVYVLDYIDMLEERDKINSLSSSPKSNRLEMQG